MRTFMKNTAAAVLTAAVMAGTCACAAAPSATAGADGSNTYADDATDDSVISTADTADNTGRSSGDGAGRTEDAGTPESSAESDTYTPGGTQTGNGEERNTAAEIADPYGIIETGDGYETGADGSMYFKCTLEDAQIAAEAFLNLETEGTKAVVNEAFYTANDAAMQTYGSGDSFSFIELVGMVKKEYMPQDSDEIPDISYAFINNAASGNYSFAVKLTEPDTGAGVGSCAVYVFEPNGDILYLTYSAAGCAENPISLNECGYAINSGSEEEGTPYTEGIITEYGRYVNIYTGVTPENSLSAGMEAGLDEAVVTAPEAGWILTGSR